MDKRGYDRTFVLGTIGASGTLGIMIPPSITLILIGMQTGQSVGRLFMGGLIAGLLLLAIFMLYVGIRSRMHPELAPGAEVRAPLAERVKAFRSVILPLIIILSVLVSIFAGIATPTEAAAVGAAAVVFSVAVRGELSFSYIREVSFATATMTGMVIWIVFGASAFIAIYGGGGGTAFMTGMLGNMNVHPLVMILIMQAITLVLGMFLDPIGIILLVLPIFFPIVVQLGFDPIWFCILFQLNLCIGYISPLRLQPFLPEKPQPNDSDHCNISRRRTVSVSDVAHRCGDIPVPTNHNQLHRHLRTVKHLPRPNPEEENGP